MVPCTKFNGRGLLTMLALQLARLVPLLLLAPLQKM
jgi:hypothetical protein